MDLEFDPKKDKSNIKVHGVSLLFGVKVFDDVDKLDIRTDRVDSGELRFRTIGMAFNRLWTVIHVMRNGRHRFISVRKSNVSETETYNRS